MFLAKKHEPKEPTPPTGATELSARTVDVGHGLFEDVQVDKYYGPIVLHQDGTTGFYCNGEHMSGCYGNRRGRQDVKGTWPNKTETEREVIINIVGKKNAAMRDWRQAQGNNGNQQSSDDTPEWMKALGYGPSSSTTFAQPTPQEKSNWFAQMSVPPGTEVHGDDRKPVVCLWYAGGLTPQAGREQLKDFLFMLRQGGLEDYVVFDYPETHDIVGEGGWSRYIDKLVADIDSDNARRGRPLLLWAHSRGCVPALSLAKRLKARVRKVYLCAAAATPPGVPSAFEVLARRLQQSSDREVLRWCASMDSSPILARTLKAVEDGGLQVDQSNYLQDLLRTTRQHYVDTIFPDMKTEVGVIDAPIMAVAAAKDAENSKDTMEGWRTWTTSHFSLQVVNTGHADVANHCSRVVDDMVEHIP